MNGGSWSEADLRVIIDEYSRIPTRVIAEKLGRSVRSIQSKAQTLNLHKSSDFRGNKGVDKEPHDGADMTFADIGKVIGCSHKAAHSAFRSAVKKIRAALAVRGFVDKDIKFLIGD